MTSTRSRAGTGLPLAGGSLPLVAAVRGQHVQHAGEQAGLGRVAGESPGLPLREGRVHEHDAGGHAAAHEPADDLPDDHELVPGERGFLFRAEPGISHRLVQQVAPLRAGLVAELLAGGVEGVLVADQFPEAAVPQHPGGPVVHGLDGQADVVWPGVRAGEEEHRADRRRALVVEDVVAALDGQERGDEHFRAGLGEGRDVPAPQRPGAAPGGGGRVGGLAPQVVLLRVIGDEPADPSGPALDGLQVVRRPAGLVVAAGEQEQPPAAVVVDGRELCLHRAGRSVGARPGELAEHLLQYERAQVGLGAGELQRLACGVFEEAGGEGRPVDGVEFILRGAEDRADLGEHVVAGGGSRPAGA